MNSTKRTARVAGLLYLLMGIPGAFSVMYVPSTLIVRGNATAKLAHAERKQRYLAIRSPFRHLSRIGNEKRPFRKAIRLRFESGRRSYRPGVT